MYFQNLRTDWVMYISSLVEEDHKIETFKNIWEKYASQMTLLVLQFLHLTVRLWLSFCLSKSHHSLVMKINALSSYRELLEIFIRLIRSGEIMVLPILSTLPFSVTGLNKLLAVLKSLSLVVSPRSILKSMYRLCNW